MGARRRRHGRPARADTARGRRRDQRRVDRDRNGGRVRAVGAVVNGVGERVRPAGSGRSRVCHRRGVGVRGPVQLAFARPLTVAPETRVASGRTKVSSQVSGSVPVSVMGLGIPAVAVAVTSCAVGEHVRRRSARAQRDQLPDVRGRGGGRRGLGTGGTRRAQHEIGNLGPQPSGRDDLSALDHPGGRRDRGVCVDAERPDDPRSIEGRSHARCGEPPWSRCRR